MPTNKFIIKKNFKEEYFPKGVCIVSGEIYYKVKGILKLLKNEEVVVTIDNIPASNETSCIVLTDKRICICNESGIKYIHYNEIEECTYQREKLKENVTEKQINATIGDWRYFVNDQATIVLKNTERINIKIIYGGIYLLSRVIVKIKLEISK